MYGIGELGCERERAEQNGLFRVAETVDFLDSSVPKEKTIRSPKKEVFLIPRSMDCVGFAHEFLHERVRKFLEGRSSQ